MQLRGRPCLRVCCRWLLLATPGLANAVLQGLHQVNGRLRLRRLRPSQSFELRRHHLFERRSVLVMQIRDVHPGQLPDQHLSELQLPLGHRGVRSQVAGLPKLLGPPQGMDHQDAAAWPQHGQALAGADGELGDADAAGARECFDQYW